MSDSSHSRWFLRFAGRERLLGSFVGFASLCVLVLCLCEEGLANRPAGWGAVPTPTSALTYAWNLPALLCFKTQTRDLAPGHQKRSSVRKSSLIGQSWCSGSTAQAFRIGGGVLEMRNGPLYCYSIMMNWLCFSKTSSSASVHPYYLPWSPKAHYHINSLCCTIWSTKWAYLLPS